jgi:hypothetical protein
MSLKGLTLFLDRNTGIILAATGALAVFEASVATSLYRKNPSKHNWWAYFFGWVNVVVMFVMAALFIYFAVPPTLADLNTL